ncbi:MAG: hypothetical protein WC874_01770, partial [Candidatus Izemoplasmatales bacterium]
MKSAAKKISQRGQVSAPFELMVAVIIMAFVIIIGTSLLMQVQQQVCKNNNDKEIEKFILNLDNTVEYRSSSKFFLKFDDCFNENKATIGIQVERAGPNSSSNCNLACGRPTERCHIFVFYTPDISGGYISKCLDVPEFTNFETGDACSGTEEGGAEEGYTVIMPELLSVTSGSTIVAEGQPRLKSGSYIFENVSS